MRNAPSRLVLASLLLLGCGGEPAATEPRESAGGTSALGAEGPVGGGGGGGTTPGKPSDGSASAGKPGSSEPTSGAGAGGSSSAPIGGASNGGSVSGAGGASWMDVFMAAPGGCAACHGNTGAGLPRLGPDIQHPTRALFDFLVRNGEAHQVNAYAAPMPAFADTLVSSADLDSIFAWLQAMPQPTTGGALFADYCSYCHGSDGRGGVVGVAYASAYHSAPFRRKGVEFRDYVRKGHVVDDKGASVPVSERHAYMPAFGAELLSDAELTLIENWLPQ